MAASGRRMGIDAVVEITAGGTIRDPEPGRLESGHYAFRVPPTQPDRLIRTAVIVGAAGTGQRPRLVHT